MTSKPSAIQNGMGMRLVTADLVWRMLLLVGLLSLHGRAVAAEEPPGKLFDAFFRFTSDEHKVVFTGLPGESVDPFTGALRVSQEDLFLPGVAGLDLHVVRTYSSKIWARSDRFTSYDPLLAEHDHSVLGYGWSLTFGLLRNPGASGDSGYCSGDLPVFVAQDGSSQVFYPFDGTVFVSKEYWRLEHHCPDPATDGICVWTDKGLRYEFSTDGDGFSGTTAVKQVSRIVDTFGNAIAFDYVPSSQTGFNTPIPPVARITDTYGRKVDFAYTYAADGARLASITANNKVYRYDYVTASSADTTGSSGQMGLPGPRRFLRTVTPPVGAPYVYDYWFSAPVESNQFALKSITYPAGGTSTYTYKSVPFFTGAESVPFAVVASRTIGGRGIPDGGTWTYDYESPEPTDYGASPRMATDPQTGTSTDLSVTKVLRPDKKTDYFLSLGFAWAANKHEMGWTYLVGLPSKIYRGDGAELELLNYQPGDAISYSPYPPPSYASTCAVMKYPNLWDAEVAPAQLRERYIYRDRAYARAPGTLFSTRFYTEYLSYDPYGQATKIRETGTQAANFTNGDVFKHGGTVTRTTDLEYWSLPVDQNTTPQTVNILRGRLSQKTVAEGSDTAQSSWTYNGPFHAMDSETVAGLTTRYAYHLGADEGPGNIKSITRAIDWRGSLTLSLQGYSRGWGSPTVIDYNGARQVYREASWEGWVTSVTDGLDHRTDFDYDAMGRTIKVTPPGDNAPTSYVWLSDDSQVTLTHGNYSKTTRFDGLGRELGTTDSLGTVTVNGFDLMGRQWFTSSPLSSAADPVGTSIQYDSLGRPITVNRAYRPATHSCDVPGACSTLYEYRANCTRTTTLRDPEVPPPQAPNSIRCYASFGDPEDARMVALGDSIGNTWQFGYTARGHLTELLAPVSSGERQYSWLAGTDLLNSASTKESGVTYFTYNMLGQQTQRSDARVRTTYGYDDRLSRLTSVTFAPRNGTSYNGGEDVTRSYDRANNLKTLSSANGGSYSYDYDEINRLTTQTWTFGGVSYTTSYSFNRAGCLESLVYPTGITISMTCDAANRTKSIAVSGGRTLLSDVTYDPSGRPTTTVLGDGFGTTTSTRYDDRGRVAQMTVPRVMDRTYGYDGNDNVTSISDALDSKFSRTMQYDNLDQLQVAIAPWLWGTAVYDYDPLGNRFLNSTGNATANYFYDGSSRLAQAQGGVRLKPVQLKWNLAGQLSWSSDGTSYLYDGHGRRVRRTSSSEDVVFHYDAAGRILAETDATGSPLRSYVYFGGKLLAVVGCVESGTTPPCNNVQWYHTDALGSVVARTDAAGQMTRLDYQPWGEQQGVSSNEGDRQYNGRVYDPGTGFHDYGARMYWPEIGRFISADSYQGDPANPASLNRYSYVHNNPYRFTDPTGHTVEVSASGGDKATTLALIARIKSTPTGSMVMAQLEKSSHLHVISAFAYDEGSSTEAIDGRGATTPGVGSDTMIKLSLKNVPEVSTGEGKKRPSLDVVLLHELVHANHFDKGEAATKPAVNPMNPPVFDDEAEQRRTISVENVYREEITPRQPARTGD